MMSKYIGRGLLVMLLPLTFGGCLWFGSTSAGTAPIPEPDVVVEVFQQEPWSSGGPLVIVPFTPGVNAEAGPMVDRLALMIVKGFSEYFGQHPGVFRVLTEAEAEDTQFVLEGQIKEFDTGSWWKVVGLGRRRVTLRIEADVRDRVSGAVVARVSGVKHYKNVRESDQMAAGLGSLIAEKVQH